jgi:hypothetical protein
VSVENVPFTPVISVIFLARSDLGLGVWGLQFDYWGGRPNEKTPLISMVPSIAVGYWVRG